MRYRGGMRLLFPSFLCLLAGVASADVFSFADYPTAQRDASAYLPCKWVSTDRPTHAYLCKGGVWATVSLQFQRQGAALTEVSLQWRNWDPQVHPAGGEAQTAAHFLEHVLYYFVPASLTAEVRNQFYAAQDRAWDEHRLVHIDYDHAYNNGYKLHSLTIRGKGKEMANQPQARPEPMQQPQQQPQQQMRQQKPQLAPAPIPPQKPATSPPRQQTLQPAPVAPVQPPPQQAQPARQQPPSRQLPEYKANVRMTPEAIEINGLSAGQRLRQVQNVDNAGPLVTEELRQKQHQIFNVLPSVKPEVYREAEDLIREAEEDDLPIFQLEPDQVAPLMQPAEKDGGL